MKACVIHGAEKLIIEDRPDPKPLEGEVLVRFGAGGICGSDLHYYHEGRVGDFAIREPMILGHEVAGEIVALGPEVNQLQTGQRVAVNPTRACRKCRYCLAGRANLCRNVRFFGSAARYPHVQGAFAEYFVAAEEQCVPVPQSLSYRVAACAEPLAVTLHAVARGGTVLGRKVLVTGAGPIGVLVAASARLAGAAEIVVTDLFDEPLATATQMGATRALNVRNSSLEEYAADGGYFDLAFESSGNVRGLENCLDLTRPAGRVVQVGIMPADKSAAPVNKVMAKELELCGTFRFHEEYEWAVNALVNGQINVEPMLSRSFDFSEAVEAFALASDRRQAMKVSLVAS